MPEGSSRIVRRTRPGFTEPTWRWQPVRSRALSSAGSSRIPASPESGRESIWAKVSHEIGWQSHPKGHEEALTQSGRYRTRAFRRRILPLFSSGCETGGGALLKPGIRRETHTAWPTPQRLPLRPDGNPRTHPRHRRDLDRHNRLLHPELTSQKCSRHRTDETEISRLEAGDSGQTG